jgi:hypothetical protein
VTTYSERLLVPVGWVLTGLALALLTALSVHGGAGGWRAVVPYAVLPPLAGVVLLVLSRDRLRVEDGVLHVPGARAPLTAFGPAEVLDRPALREWLGVRAQRDAWVRVKPWHRTAVRLPVTDPEDDTPYWLVGTRRPVDLAVALTALPDGLSAP